MTQAEPDTMASTVAPEALVVPSTTPTSGRITLRATAWRDVHLALGSVAATTIRAPLTEAALEGASPAEAIADRAASTLVSEIDPIDDVRSSADYRRAVAARVLHRLLREAGGW